jgi:AraC family transcriptional regulator of adaptative response/methylated-DNA-[protein]-cysteine methyltransferase
MMSEGLSQAVGSALSEEACWEALMERDPAAQGSFVYGVLTTGVFCRPACPSRRPRRDNVRFYATPEDARRAGFRACRRCRPGEAGVEAQHAAAVAEACRMIETAETLPSLADLAERAGLSRFHFHRLFKAQTGVTPKAYATAHRAGRVRRELLAQPTVTGALYEAGFGSSGRFYAVAGDRLGMTPTAFRDGGAGSVIRYAVSSCSLGAILVAATEKGICAIEFGEDEEALAARPKTLFPKAELIGDDPDFSTLVDQVIAFVEAPGTGLDLPLDIRGTAFQERVWRALRAIPVGSTASYAEIAARIGFPKAVRAVAGACAANRLAVAIPCHRVVRTGGDLSGYRWGVERKRALLRKEGVDRTASGGR